MRSVTYPKDFEEWRTLTRSLLLRRVSPSDLIWQPQDEASLFGETEIPVTSGEAPRVPKEFIELALSAACYRSGEQWPLLYSMLWRLTHGEAHLLRMSTDPEVHRIKNMVKSINRDIHKMHAFVRFRKVGEAQGREQFVAWFEPDHHIVKLTTSFFRKRFTAMDWSILTPDCCMHWDGHKIHYTPGVDKSHAPNADAQDELWRSYYKSIFNPARLKVKAMQSEMPKKYWENLPEAEIIHELISSSAKTTEEMLQKAASPEKPAPKNSYLEKLQTLD